MDSMTGLDEEGRLKQAEALAARQSSTMSASARDQTKPLVGDDKVFMDQIMLAIDQNVFFARCCLAQRMTKQKVKPTKEQLDSYSASCHNDALKLFRLDWAKAEKSRLVEKYSFTQTWQEVDVSKGQYLPFKRVWQEEGGGTPKASKRRSSIAKRPRLCRADGRRTTP